MIHRISGSGWHRLECSGCIGELVPYKGIAKLSMGGKTFAATTEYWSGTLPSFFEIAAGPANKLEIYEAEGITEKDKEFLQQQSIVAQNIFRT